MKKILIYDTTLRDGAQGDGVAFSDSGKLKFAHALDEFGVDFIEGGFAGSNPRDLRFFEDIRREKLARAKVAAFGSTRRKNLDAADDPQLQGLLRAETEYATIYGKSWLLHVKEVLKTSADQNVQMVADTVGFLHQNGRKVIFDAEHFFDGYRDNPEYALSVLRAAVREGAEVLTLCDTNGGRLPHEVFEICSVVTAEFPKVQIGIHTHNDAGLGVANSLEAVRAGAVMVQGTMNGLGERTGNANLTSIIPALECKMNVTCVGKSKLRKLRAVSALTDELTNQRPDPRQPYVGRTAFSHKAGAHVNAVQKNPESFEHLKPETVGNERRILVSELSGGSNIGMKASELGFKDLENDQEATRKILAAMKAKENQGYSFESADGSFKLLMHKVMDTHKRLFELQGFRVIVEKRGRDQPCISEATVKVSANGETALTVGEGTGPVDALNVALRKALRKFYPEIDTIKLSDYRVRILDPESAAGAVTRVVIESTDGKRQWGTVGVSQNIIEASWEALLDSIEFKLHENVNKRQSDK